MPSAVLHKSFPFDNRSSWPAAEEQAESKDGTTVVIVEDSEDRPCQSDIWSAIQAQKAAADLPAPYVHPLMRRSSSSMSQKSLEICTESLGSETGSDDISGFLDSLNIDYSPQFGAEEEEAGVHGKLEAAERVWIEEETDEHGLHQHEGEKMVSVNYHHSHVSKRSPPRQFPPPLKSLSSRDVPCLHVRPRRAEGRLVLDAVAASSKNYLHAQREGGRLLLSLVNTALGNSSVQDLEASPDSTEIVPREEPHPPTDEEFSENEEIEAEEIAQFEEAEEEEEQEEEEEEEEEVEVLDRGTVVEVKVSTQPQQQSGGVVKVLRSSLVINKFVGGGPLITCNPNTKEEPNAAAACPPSRRSPTTTATVAAAVAVASTLTTTAQAYKNDSGHGMLPEKKLLFTSKRRNREELLHSMRRCSQLHRSLFVWEPCYIATSKFIVLCDA